MTNVLGNPWAHHCQGDCYQGFDQVMIGFWNKDGGNFESLEVVCFWESGFKRVITFVIKLPTVEYQSKPIQLKSKVKSKQMRLKVSAFNQKSALHKSSYKQTVVVLAARKECIVNQCTGVASQGLSLNN